MSQKPENRFIDRLNNKLPIKKRRGSAKAREQHAQHMHYEKMANPYRGGTADSWYSGKNDIWIEFKYLPTMPVTKVVKPLEMLSTLQQEWLNERRAEGREVYVVIGCPDGGVVLKDGEWNGELPAQQFRSLVISLPQLSEFICQRVFEG